MSEGKNLKASAMTAIPFLANALLATLGAALLVAGGATVRDLIAITIGLAIGFVLGYLFALWDMWMDRKNSE